MTPIQAAYYIGGAFSGGGGGADKGNGPRSDPRFPGKRVVTVNSMSEFRKMQGG